MSILTELPQDELELEMTPMIDVTFLLLLFFLLTLRFKTLEGKLSAYLPKDVGRSERTAPEVERIELEVSLVEAGERRDPADPRRAWSGTGRFEFVGRRLRYRVGPRRYESLRGLTARLAELRAARPDGPPRPVTIAAGRGVSYGDVVPVLDAALEAGYLEVVFRGSVE